MVTPEFLKKGDTIAIISPAAALPDVSCLEKAVAVIHSWGLNVVTSSNCLSKDGYYAGNSSIRGSEMLSLLTDKKVKAILCSYGGYGCIHIVDEFATAISENPKWIIGMSDCCVLHAAALSKGIISLHSPQCRHIGNMPKDKATESLCDILFGKIPCYKTKGHLLNIPGRAQGTVVGGNLSVLCSLLRTPYDMLRSNTILFIEDVNEPFYKIERMIYNLRLAGVFKSISALIIGEFIDIKGCSRFNESVYNMIHRLVSEYNIPVCFNFPVGHGENNLPLIEGANADIYITTDEVQLFFTPRLSS